MSCLCPRDGGKPFSETSAGNWVLCSTLWPSRKNAKFWKGISCRPTCTSVSPYPRKHPVASVIGFLKGKSAIAIARMCGKERNFSGEHFWARGYAVSTVGFELEQVRKYIREQELVDGNPGQF